MDQRIKVLSGISLALVFASLSWAQTCAKQPPIKLSNVEEWACKGMDYDAAWNTLTAAQIAPVRPAKVMELGTQRNYTSKKHILIRGLRIAGFAATIAGSILANNVELTDLQLAALLAGPQVAAEGVSFFSGAPDDFVQTPSDAGFVTIFSGPTNQQIVALPAPAVPLARPALSFQPTDWHTLLVESRVKSAERLQMNQAEQEHILLASR